MLDINNISYKNTRTWNLFHKGLTRGVFQLETDLGSYWSQQIKPNNISELSALIALIRPSCLQSGLIEEYARIKHGEIDVVKFDDETIDKILEPTLGILLFQEQILAIAEQVAWRHLPKLDRLIKADKLRKGIGKKDSKLILSLREDFINGCVTNGRNIALADKIFDLIEDSGRYSFNSAHAYKYGHYSYKTAYLKANHPLEFYTTYLSYSKFKMKHKNEIRNLIDEATLLNINIIAPNILYQNKEFRIIDYNKKIIAYGLNHIKNVGEADINIIQHEKIDNWTKLLVTHFDKKRETRLRSSSVEALICSGSCDSYGIPRSILLDVFQLFKRLTPKEIKFIITLLQANFIESIHELKHLLTKCVEQACMKQRKPIVESEIKQLDLDKKDTFTWRANKEQAYLGLSLTCSAVDDKKIDTKTTCNDCKKITNNNGINVKISVILDECKQILTKKGKQPNSEMAILSVRDNTGSLKIACFPSQYRVYMHYLYENTVYEMHVQGTGRGWCIKKLIKI